MLSAFMPQPLHELKPKDKARIESLLAYGDRLLVGLSTGALRVYRVNEQQVPVDQDASNGETVPVTPSKSKAVELLREEDKFGKKPVQQLAIVKEANLLVSLSDGYVSLHDLQTYQLVERLEQTRSAICFAVTSNVIKDPETNIPGLVSRLAVGVKRKILLWTWQDMELSENVEEIALEAAVKSLTWLMGNKVVVGMDAGFSIVDIETKEIVPVNKPASRATAVEEAQGELAGVRFAAVSSSGMGYMGMGSWVPKPLATRLSDHEILLAKDVNTMFTDAEGNALEKRQIPWSLAPEAVGYSYPYLLGLQPPERGQLQVRNPETLTLLQTISVPQAMLLHVPQPNISLAHAGKGFLVASDRVIWRMNAMPYPAQIDQLIEKARFDEAVSLLGLLEDTLIDDKAGRTREVQILKAINLFEQQKYRPALDLFSDAQAPPERVIALYPRAVAGDLSSRERKETGLRESESAADDKNGKPEGSSKDAPKEPPSTPQKSVLGRLVGSHKRAGSDGPTPKTPAKQDSDNASIKTATPSKSGTAEKETALEGEDLKQATRALCSFLAQARVQIQKYLSTAGELKEQPPVMDSETGKPVFGHLLPQSLFTSDTSKVDWQAELLRVAQLVDTTLFRAYMLALPSLAGPLFRLDNFCEPEVVQASLYESHRYGDLIDFLHGKKLHRQALELLTKFGRGEEAIDPPEGMRGPERTVAYLKQLPPEMIELVLEFVRWPIEDSPDTGLSVFLADSDNAEKLDREKVLHFLASISTSLQLRYLEHIVTELADPNPAYHQTLAELYLEYIKSGDTSEPDQLAAKTKLEAFLTTSTKYNKARIFRLLPTDNPLLHESRAIVLSAMGNHKQALSIYVFQLSSPQKAEEYCNRIYLAQQAQVAESCLLDNVGAKSNHHPAALSAVDLEVSAESGENVYAMLLGLYLSPADGEVKRWAEALELLSKHGARLPASSTLDLMPSDLAVKELASYFRGRIRHATSLLREDRIIASLEAVRKADAETVLRFGTEKDAGLGGRMKRVVIREEDHCPVCFKRFGASAVRVKPSGEVVHYGCISGKPGERTGRGLSGIGRAWG
nr:hypothetical protein B0A51_14264 [Rachicladosporium sp. CCFEE 5018]